MPIYHFHFASAAGSGGDVGSRDLADDQAALREGRDAAIEILQTDVVAGHLYPSIMVSIDRDDGSKVAMIAMQAQVTICADPV